MKKVLFGLATFVLVLATVPMFSAFEAHVINVTAQIENALFIHPASRNFGVVFPQEFFVQGVFVSFSESFSESDQTRVGNVDYVIKQKPKPLPAYEEEVGVPAARTWCHDNYPQVDFDENDQSWINYRENCYPSLCPYLSKHPEIDEDPFTEGNQSNDTGVAAFHDPFDPENYAFGRIEKFAVDVADVWAIDLAVPCFEGHCAQDWADFVHNLNPEADPELYKLPIELEHEVFGCDLWFEVTNIS